MDSAAAAAGGHAGGTAALSDRMQPGGCHLDREAIEQDFSGWLQQRRDEALGLSCAQRWLYLAVTPEDEVIGSAAVAAGEGGFVRSIWLHPDCDQSACREQIEQQLTDMGF